MMLSVMNDGSLVEFFQALGGKYFNRLLIDAVAVAILLFGIYLPHNHRHREYLFTFVMFNLVIFHIAFLLSTVQFSMGAAFGLFAVFGLLRYRTENIPIKDMTYLFVVIAFGLITAMTRGDWEPAIFCLVLLVPTFLLDSEWIFRKELRQDVLYEKIELIKPEHRSQLMEDLRTRTGLNIHFLQIKTIDFVRDTAEIRVFYSEPIGVPKRKAGETVV